jgi:hypothetical protein
MMLAPDFIEAITEGGAKQIVRKDDRSGRSEFDRRERLTDPVENGLGGATRKPVQAHDHLDLRGLD